MSVRVRRGLFIGLPVVLIGCAVLFALASRSGHLSFNPPVAHRDAFVPAAGTTFPPALQANGNRLVTDDGRVVLLRGVMVAEPSRLYDEHRLNREFLTGIRSTGANAVRIPVHPEYWVRDPDYLWRNLDPLVQMGGELGLYVIIDWHYIGNIATGEGPEMPDIAQRPKEISVTFWRLVARYFRSAPHVIFEVFNEPASIGSATWRESANELVQAIRARGAPQLVIVGGTDYGRDLSWVSSDPLPDRNLAYASHIYPSHSASGWSSWFGRAADRYPVVITEWGYMDENRNPDKAYLSGDRQSYGEPFLAYLRERGIGWVACWYDDTWEPPMFQAGWQARTRWGEFVLEQLAATKS